MKSARGSQHFGSGTQSGPRLGLQPLADEREVVCTNANLSKATSTGSALVWDEAAPRSSSDRLFGDMKVGSEVSHRPPCLRS